MNLSQSGYDDRRLWGDLAEQLATPVLSAGASRRLKAEMPVEVSSKGSAADRGQFSHLEAVGRLLNGLAPWLELGADESAEGKRREHWGQMARATIDSITDPASADFLEYGAGGQPLVDASFLAQAMLRAPVELWEKLNPDVRHNVLSAFRRTRRNRPFPNNWLLFAATIEAFFASVGEEWDEMRVDYALRQHDQWFKGDATYGDGADFYWDYYNSYVIQPMIVDVVRACVTEEKWGPIGLRWQEGSVKNLRRYAQILEHLISPEGTFPMLGRSSAYRCGAFHALAQASLMDNLADTVSPAQVRCGLTAILQNQMRAPGTFDEKGWLQIGFCGHQPEIGERYISTGSLYLCSFALLPLGLPVTDPFWASPGEPWTQRRVWKVRF